jgi:hypothetical protein
VSTKQPKRYEDKVADALHLANKEAGNGWEIRSLPSGSPFDFVVAHGKAEAKIESRWAEPADKYLYDLWIAMAQEAARSELGHGLVLVVRERPKERLSNDGVAVLNDVNKKAQVTELRTAIERALK